MEPNNKLAIHCHTDSWYCGCTERRHCFQYDDEESGEHMVMELKEVVQLHKIRPMDDQHGTGYCSHPK